MRKGFTLIELIFVIVIIGLLAAVAVPKFVNLKQHAEAANVVKTTIDAAQQAVEVAINQEALENNTSYTLQDLVRLDGKGWSYANNEYDYDDNGTVASVKLDKTNKKVTYSIDCTKFSDPITQDKCKKLIGNKDSISVDLTY